MSEFDSLMQGMSLVLRGSCRDKGKIHSFGM